MFFPAQSPRSLRFSGDLSAVENGVTAEGQRMRGNLFGPDLGL